MHLRHFKKGNKKYYYISETSKKAGKIVQKYLMYVGNAETLYKKLKALKKV